MKNGLYTENAGTGKDICDKIKDMPKDEIATICATITSDISKSLEAVGDKFQEYTRKYPEIMAFFEFGIIATVNSAPFEDPPVLIMAGTAAGIQHAATPIISGLKQIAEGQANDKETV